MGNTVSTSVIRRLPRYYRFLQELMNNGIIRISSRELSEKMGFTASQIRQDFNCFGGFGQQGYGYNVSELHAEIGKILGVDKGYKTILIGAGNLGRAIATHMNFDARGCKLIGIFDVNPELANVEVGNLKIMHTDKIESFCNENSPVIAILCIPKESAQEIADTLVKHGIKAFWNFSHCDLKPTFNDIIVENAHLGDSLMTMVYNVNASSDN
ncbi:MAG: redox-sensing transcriptional repressor Rex [Oscillospiraceae bacterium]|nr:redox-sensing transcriptional repressor Rex [Oscillospiraceae bacterium]